MVTTLGIGLISFLFGILGALAFESAMGQLAAYKDSLAALQSVVAIAAIIAAGYWFIRRRSSLPRSDIALSVSHRKVAQDRNWLRVSVKIENKGEVLLRLAHAEILVQQILPVPTDIARLISEGESPVPEGQVEIPWNVLEKSHQTPKGCEIEPGETDTLHWDFILPQVSTVLIYAHFRNVEKGELGWTGSLIYDVNGGSSDEYQRESYHAE